MRYIDEIIARVREHPSISEVHKQVLVNRIEQAPTPAELEKARAQLGRPLITNPLACIVKITAIGVTRECGHPCQYLTEEQARAEGLMYSGWYHAGTPRPHLGHNAVPRSYL